MLPITYSAALERISTVQSGCRSNHPALPHPQRDMVPLKHPNQEHGPPSKGTAQPESVCNLLILCNLINDSTKFALVGGCVCPSASVDNLPINIFACWLGFGKF